MPEYRRRLPHFQPQSNYLFVTWRLYGSLPVKHNFLGKLTAGSAFAMGDRELDRQLSGPRWMAEPDIATLVSRAILYGESGRQFYHLNAWVVMPNHVHMLILPLVPVPKAMRWLKGSTARGANLVLGRTREPFWQDESYDHYLRDSTKLQRTVSYIEGNPVSAGLVSSAAEWRWSSAGWQAEAPAPPTL